VNPRCSIVPRVPAPHSPLDVFHGGKPLHTVFGLAGRSEPALTDSLGWVLGQAPGFLADVMEVVLPGAGKAVTSNTTVNPQRHVHDRALEASSTGGFTDVEIFTPDLLHVIVEAKVGWGLPTAAQLRRYRGRLAAEPNRALVVLTEATASYMSDVGLPSIIDGVAVKHIRWRDVARIASKAAVHARLHRRALLREFVEYLNETAIMIQPDTARVLVVALSSNYPEWGGTMTWRQHVDHRRYTHPVGRRWPRDPLTHIAFRFNGELLSIHHIDSVEVARDLSSLPGAPKGDPALAVTSDHFIYHLGPPFAPSPRPRSGSVLRASHRWCYLDTLFTNATVADAARASAERDAAIAVQ
jgi:hypothetical protein